MSDALRRRKASTTAVNMPRTAPCQTNCSSAHPMACAIGWRMKSSIVVIVLLLRFVGAAPGRVGSLVRMKIGMTSSLPAPLEQPPDLTQLLRRRSPGRESLHHELGRGTAESAIQEVADQLALRLPFGHPCLIDMGAVGVVST